MERSPSNSHFYLLFAVFGPTSRMIICLSHFIPSHSLIQFSDMPFSILLRLLLLLLNMKIHLKYFTIFVWSTFLFLHPLSRNPVKSQSNQFAFTDSTNGFCCFVRLLDWVRICALLLNKSVREYCLDVWVCVSYAWTQHENNWTAITMGNEQPNFLPYQNTSWQYHMTVHCTLHNVYCRLFIMLGPKS